MGVGLIMGVSLSYNPVIQQINLKLSKTLAATPLRHVISGGNISNRRYIKYLM